MKFQKQLEDTLGRLLEAKLTLDLISSMETPPPGKEDMTVLSLRGLFFVHLYACLEYGVNQGIQRALSIISACEVERRHYTPRFLTIAMANEFAGIRDAGKKQKWRKRIYFIDTAFSSDVSSINEAALSDELQNVWVKTIEEVFECLGINSPPLPDMSFSGHIDHIVDSRNAVAHGRKSASEAASGSRASTLTRYWEIVSATIEHLFSTMSRFIDNCEFVIESERTTYAKKLSDL